MRVREKKFRRTEDEIKLGLTKEEAMKRRVSLPKYHWKQRYFVKRTEEEIAAGMTKEEVLAKRERIR